MKKIKVLMIGLSNNLGGIETYLVNLYRKIDKSKFDIKFLVFNDNMPCFYDEIKEDLIFITPRKNNYKQFKRELKQILFTGQFDFIHCNLMSFSLYEPIVFALKYSKAKIVLHSHVSGKIKNTLKTKIISSFAKMLVLNNNYSDRYIFLGCSQNAIDDLFGDFYRKNNCYFSVVNNGIDVSKFTFSEKMRKKIRGNISIADDIILLGHVGRFTYAKNHKKILSIFNYLAKKSEKYKLLLIGDGELRQDIINLIDKYNIRDRVVLLSNVSNVNDYLNAIDCFIFPSIFEGLGIAVVEAQVSGLPCIISNTIPKEVEITDNIFRCDLESSDEEWGLIIQNINFNNRNIDIHLFSEFDSSNSALNLEKIYIENYKGE